jgi:hypothetical protein
MESGGFSIERTLSPIIGENNLANLQIAIASTPTPLGIIL